MIFNLYYLSYGLMIGSFIMYVKTKKPYVFVKNNKKNHIACMCSDGICKL